jgi:hypothetical protein
VQAGVYYLAASRIKPENAALGRIALSSESTVVVGETEVSKPVELEWSAAQLRFTVSPVAPAVKLSVTHVIEEPNRTMTTIYQISAKPDKQGRCEVDGLSDSLREVSFRTDAGSARRTVRPVKDLDLDLGVVTLEENIVVTGAVLDPQGNAVAEALVFATFPEGGNAICATDQKGKFAFRGLPAGSVSLRASHRLWGEARKELTLTETDSVREWNLSLGTPAEVFGRVTVNKVRPTPAQLGASAGDCISVVLFDAADAQRANRSNLHLARAYGRLDYLGQFVLENVVAGDYVLVAVLGNRESAHASIKVEQGKRAECSLDIGRASGVRGRIVARDGNALAFAEVNLCTKDQFGGVGLDEVYRTKTGAQGEYEFADVPEGAYFLRLEGESDLQSQEQLALRAVKVVAGEVTVKDLDLSASKGATISGKALIGGMKLFSEAVLVKPDDFASLRGARLDEEGRFKFDDVAHGNYYLWFTNSRYSPAHLAREVLEIKGDTVVERDYACASLSGNVRIEGPGALKDVRVKLAPMLENKLGGDPLAMLAVI